VFGPLREQACRVVGRVAATGGRALRTVLSPELLKHGIFVAKSTVQRYLSRFRSVPPQGQRWSTFLKNQAAGIWCCDLFEVRDLLFRCHFAFVVMHLESRRIPRATTTAAPSSSWLAQQLRELTPFGDGPKFLLRDNDAKFGTVFDRVAAGAGIRVIRTPIRAPKANSHVERLIGSVRRECLDHVLVRSHHHLQQLLDESAPTSTTPGPTRASASGAQISPTNSLVLLYAPLSHPA